jgi:hypothetical protein
MLRLDIKPIFRPVLLAISAVRVCQKCCDQYSNGQAAAARQITSKVRSVRRCTSTFVATMGARWYSDWCLPLGSRVTTPSTVAAAVSAQSSTSGTGRTAGSTRSSSCRRARTALEIVVLLPWQSGSPVVSVKTVVSAVT